MKPSPKAVRTFLRATLFPLFLAWTAGPPSASAQTIQVTSANPSSAAQGTVNLNVTINGQGFKKGVLAKFYVTGTTDPGGVAVNSTTFVNSSELVANINVSQNGSISKFDILVTNTNGRTGKGTELFAVVAPDPAIGYTAATYSALMVMNTDGTNQTMILQPPNPQGSQRAASVYRPNWSPDGSQLVFESTIQGDGIYLINKDGSGLREVIALNNGSGLAYPVWSPLPAPDGKFKIAFSDQVSGQFQNNLFLVNLDGTGLVNLTNSIQSQFSPTWDPHATRLGASVSPCPPNTSCTYHLYEYSLGLVNGAVGITSTTDLTASGPLQSANIFQPYWAKTQDKIALLAHPLSNLNSSNLWIVSLADPANPVELTAGATWPSWSPDDSKIVFGNGTIYMVNPDGSGLISLNASGTEPSCRRCCPTCVIPCAQ